MAFVFHTSPLIRSAAIAIALNIAALATAQAAPPSPVPMAGPCPAVDCINLPADSGALNVKDFGAKGDGVTDDTAAINAALAASGNGNKFWQSKMVYLPIGTYLVSAPIMKKYADGNFASGMVLVGQSRQATIIKLKNYSPAYRDARNPRAVIFTSSKLLDQNSFNNDTRDYINKGEGNDAYSNFIENLTVDVGTVNPGAIGIDYLANNHGAIRRVTVKAHASSGHIGIAMQRKWPGPALIQDVTVQGFTVGMITAHTEYGMTLDRVSLSQQRAIGLYNVDNVLAVSALSIQNTPIPVANATNNGLITIAGGQITHSTAKGGEAIHNSGNMNIRNLSVTGYSSTLGVKAANAATAVLVDGAYYGNNKSNAATQAWSNQPVAAPDSVNSPVEQWVNVASYGATPDSGMDATAAIRQAMASGADTIYFPFGSYLVSDNIIVPASVQRIVGMNATLRIVGTGDRAGSFDRAQGVLRAMNTTKPLTIEHLTIDSDDLGDQVSFEASGTEALVLRDTISAGSQSFWRPATGGQLFVENFTGGKAVIEGSAGVWLRQFNSEGDGTRLTNNGAPLWVLGMKTEGNVVALNNLNGARTDILGGLFFIASPNADETIPLFRNTDSQLLASYVEEAISTTATYKTHLAHTMNGGTRTVLASTLPSRDRYGRMVTQLNTAPMVVTAPTTTTTNATKDTAPVATGPVFGDSFGINIKTERVTKAELDLIAAVGVKRVRVAIPWYAIEFLKGVYRWDYTIWRHHVADDYATRKTYDFDSMMAAIRERKLHVDVTLHESNGAYVGQPINVAPAGHSPAYTLPAPRTTEAIQGFADFAAATVQHYNGIYGKEAITWHIWNEPDTDGSFAPRSDASIFGKLMSTTCETIRKTSPQARVMGAALSARGDGDLPLDFITGLFTQANPLNCVDGFSVHPYRSYVPETVPADFAKVAERLAPWQPANKPKVPVMTDEWGYSMNKQWSVPYHQKWRTYTGEEQAALVLRMYLTNLKANVPITIVYDWRNRGTDAYEWEDNFGFLTFDGQEKPSLKMLRAVWPNLNGRKLDTKATLTGCTTTEHVARFGSKENDASWWSIVWTTDTKARPLTINGAVQKVMDIFGKPVTMGTDQRVMLTGHPVLIQHAAANPPSLACPNTVLAAK